MRSVAHAVGVTTALGGADRIGSSGSENNVNMSYRMLRYRNMKFHGISPTLFGSPARAAVLTTMLRSGAEELTGREVARRAGVSPPRAIEALRVLERERLC